MKLLRRWAVPLGGTALLGLASCQTANFPEYFRNHLNETYLQEHRLPPLTNAVTRREQIESALGPPTHRYQEGRISAYRLILHSSKQLPPYFQQWLRAVPTVSMPLGKASLDQQLQQVTQHGRLVVVTDENDEEQRKLIAGSLAEYSLVVAYDPAGVLTRHALRLRLP